ncbi:MAG TPA: D-glycerate dehydrogenase, partial [Acidimicrobiales bacterium]|nr:D-glycerate dehydrogenase [Acidimicrobiales bacterium]
MPRVLVTRKLPAGSLDPLEEAGFEVVQRGTECGMTAGELIDAVHDVDGVISLLSDRIDSAVIGAGSGRLRVVANVAVGYDNIDVRAAHDAGVAVCNTPGVLDDSTADLTMLLILAASRMS